MTTIARPYSKRTQLLIEVYTLPTATGYGRREDFAIPKGVPLIVAGQILAEIAVREILG